MGKSYLSKSETRNPKSQGNPNDETRNPNPTKVLNDADLFIRRSDFVIHSDFGFRISSFLTGHWPIYYTTNTTLRCTVLFVHGSLNEFAHFVLETRSTAHIAFRSL